jgi:iron(III) transport system permease protein
VPGSVIAIGLIVPLAIVDRAVADLFGWERYALLTGSIAGLVFLYVARFFAAAHGAARASMARVTPAMDAAARSLGRGPFSAAWNVHLPVMGPSLLSAVLIVFIDVMKELPGTLILRPFNFDTLAIATYHLAADERIAELAAPALGIVGAVLIPVILLMRAIAAGRPGGIGERLD